MVTITMLVKVLSRSERAQFQRGHNVFDRRADVDRRVVGLLPQVQIEEPTHVMLLCCACNARNTSRFLRKEHVDRMYTKSQ